VRTAFIHIPVYSITTEKKLQALFEKNFAFFLFFLEMCKSVPGKSLQFERNDKQSHLFAKVGGSLLITCPSV